MQLLLKETESNNRHFSEVINKFHEWARYNSFLEDLSYILITRFIFPSTESSRLDISHFFDSPIILIFPAYQPDSPIFCTLI